MDIIGRLLFWALFLFMPKPSNNKPVLPKKILILELWGMGDVVMMSCVLGPLRRNYPNAKIALLVKPHAAVILKHNNNIDELIEFDFPWTKFRHKYRFWQWDWKSLIKIVGELSSRKFDLAICGRGDIRNNILLFFIQATRRVGYDFTGGGYFLTDVVDKRSSRKHRINDWNRILAYLGLDMVNSYPQICITKDESNQADKFIMDQGIKSNDLIIGIHPGARVDTRRWPLDRFASVVKHLNDKFNVKIIIFVSPDGYGEGISGNIIKAKVPLRELIALINKVSLFICNDSGPMHIATALNTPVVALYGPTDPQWFGPYGGVHKIVMKEGVKCRPCYDYCEHDSPFCIEQISVDEVMAGVDNKVIDLIS